MRNIITCFGAVVTVAALLGFGSGCAREQSPSSLTATVSGRLVKASVEGPATIKTEGDAAIITFGKHRLRVEKERLVLDEGKMEAGIPAPASVVELVYPRGFLTMKADGEEVLRTPIKE